MLHIFILSEKKIVKSEKILKALAPQVYPMSNAPEILGAVEMEEKDTRDRHTAFALSMPWCEGSVASNLARLC